MKSVAGDTRKGQLGFTAISDVDNDGVNEIIFATSDTTCLDFYGDLYVANVSVNNISIEANISLGNEGGAWGAVAIANLDSDDREEIVVPGYYGIKVYDFDNNQLSLKCNNTDGKIEAAPVIYDVDRDNDLNIRGVL